MSLNSSFSVKVLRSTNYGPHLVPFLKEPKKRMQERLPSLCTPDLSTTVDSLQERLRSRRRVAVKAVDPELAAQVIKEYLLPVFIGQKHTDLGKCRLAQFGLEQSSTVLSELKLSVALSEKVSELTKELQVAKVQASEALQNSLVNDDENQRLRTKCVEVEHERNVFKYQYIELMREGQQYQQKLDNLTQQVESYKNLNSKQREEIEELSALVHQERINNDKLNNSVVQLAHINDLLHMENEIMGEKLKGIYESINDVLPQKHSEQKLSDQSKAFGIGVKLLTTDYEQLFTEYKDTVKQKENLWMKLENLGELYEELKAHKNEHLCKLGYKLENCEYSIKKLNEEVMNLSVTNEDQQKSLQNLAEENERLRAQTKLFNKFKASQSESQICKNCRFEFSEHNNFNWSCKRHSSSYSGEFYWCCGRKGETATGCIMSKHEAHEGPEEGSEKEALVSACTSCKQPDHSVQQCPADPNLRSGYDPMEEYARINKKYKDRKSSNIKLLELNSRLNGMLQVEVEEIVSQPRFNDIHEIKAAMSFDEKQVRSRQNFVKSNEQRRKTGIRRSVKRISFVEVPKY